MKCRREKERGSPTPGMVKGVTTKRLDILEVLKCRIFRTRIELPPRWAIYYDRKIKTIALQKNRIHDLSYAY